MTLRKAAAYSKKKIRPYTRNSSRKNRAYIKAIPYSKIVKFRMGDEKSFRENKHPFVIKMISTEGVQMRDTSLEAARMLLHKLLEDQVPGQYFIAVRVAPHNFIRENKLAAGAGADRMATGMTQSFGVVVGRTALVKPEQEVIVVSCANEKAARIAKDALATIKSKVPGRMRISFERVLAVSN